MAITINTAPETNDLTILRMVKDVLGIDDLDTSQDNLITDVIHRASALISRYCNRDFAKQTITETLPSIGGPNLMVSRFPIVSITHIKYQGETLDAADYVLQSPETGQIYSESDWINTQGVYDYEVKYIHGYVLPGFTTGTRNLPYDLEHGCIELAKLLYLSRDHNPHIESESVPNVYSVKYRTGKGASSLIPPQVEEIIDAYRVYKI